MPLNVLGTFALTCLIIEITPGPNMAYLAVLSAGNGRRAGFAATAGIALGMSMIGISAALGLAALISESRVLYEALRWAGVGYLLWLAWDSWHDAVETTVPVTDTTDLLHAVFRRGLITNLLNPKSAIFYLTVLPTFVDVARPVLWQTLILTAVYVSIATAIHLTIVILAGAARPLLEDPVRRRKIRQFLALALAAIAIWFAVSSAR
jgi:threonine/homoserine/homoserine lactone efflux protein